MPDAGGPQNAVGGREGGGRDRERERVRGSEKKKNMRYGQNFCASLIAICIVADLLHAQFRYAQRITFRSPLGLGSGFKPRMGQFGIVIPKPDIAQCTSFREHVI